MSAFERRLIGASPAFLSVVRAARVVAATDVSILVLGETGTGKDCLAHAIHEESRRRDGNFVAVNCASLPEALAESLLFGHCRGAFTGAVKDHQGYLAAADEGTLFLDEVGELPLTVQAKMLRFLESGESLPVGDTQPRRLRVRIIAATNRDLPELVAAGRFRADLFYRLHVVPLELPPLRERDGDLEVLLSHLTQELAAQHQIAAPRYSGEALRALRRYPWPGNVRELRNFAERILVLLSGQTITAANLPLEIRAGEAGKGGAGASGFRLPVEGLRLDDLEADVIRQALERTRGNRSRAARLLGLTRDTLLYRMKKYLIPA